MFRVNRSFSVSKWKSAFLCVHVYLLPRNCTFVFVGLCLCFHCLCASSCVVKHGGVSFSLLIICLPLLSLLYLPRRSTSPPITTQPLWIFNQSTSTSALSFYSLAFSLTLCHTFLKPLSLSFPETLVSHSFLSLSFCPSVSLSIFVLADHLLFRTVGEEASAPHPAP